MSRIANDGRGRLGGRTKGTPNKPPVSRSEWISGLINRNRKQYEEDLRGLDPCKRAEILTQLICQGQSLSVEDQIGNQPTEEDRV